jgi:curved DNA-binding protein CbpA
MRRSPLNPWEVLGVPQDSDEQTVRAAYLAQVRANPPERSPDKFEQIRDAYEVLRDPRQRMRQLLDADPTEGLDGLLEHHPPERRFVGPEPWLAVLKRKDIDH